MTNSNKTKLFEEIVGAINIKTEEKIHALNCLEGLVNDLSDKFPGCEIYFQGSNKLGTVVKPYIRDKKGDYDFDIVIQFQNNGKAIPPEQLKNLLGEYLLKSPYRNQIKESRRCWTLFFNSDEKLFHIDLLPCVEESIEKKQSIIPKTYVKTAIAITNIIDKNKHPYEYNYITSNPKGYAKWFLDTNDLRYSHYIKNERSKMKLEDPKLYQLLLNMDIEFTRSPLQKVIQVLKRHRDVMYANKPMEKYKPISIIITTLVGKIVETNDITQNNACDLLNSVLNGLLYYSKLVDKRVTTDSCDDFKDKYLITKRIGKDGYIEWYIKNPANDNENLADKWSKDPNYASEFFNWVKRAQEDLIYIFDQSPEEILKNIKENLGEDVYDKIKDFDFYEDTFKEISIRPTTPKPYYEENE